MKKIFFILYSLIFILFPAMAQVDAAWTDAEVRAANTAATCPFLSQVERDVVLYNNLARLYPQKFARVEVAKEPGNSSVSSLMSDLNSMSPVGALLVHARETELAKCWAEQSGIRGITGHKRIGCDDYYIGGYGAENCSYGRDNGRDIILQLLIDKNTPSLGHRINCLNGKYRSLGVGFATHAEWGYCCVQDFTSYEGVAYPMASGSTYRQTPATSDDGTEAAQPNNRSVSGNGNSGQRTIDNTGSIIENRESNDQRLTTNDQRLTTVITNETTNDESLTISDQRLKTKKDNVFRRFYAHSGYHSLSYFSAGYTYSFVDQRHMVSASLLDFRLACVGFSPLCAELSVSPWDTRVAYRPAVRFYLPVCNMFAFVPYASVAVDASYLGEYFSDSFTWNKSTDFYVSAIAGLALYLSAAKHVPIELRAEYRHPIIEPQGGAMHPKGFYLGAHIYFGSVFAKK